MQRPSTVPSKTFRAANIVVGQGCAFAGLQRQARLRSVERLDLAFLVDGQDHRVAGRRHVKANRVLDFFGEGGTVGLLEGVQAVRLKTVGLPDAFGPHAS